GAIFVSRAGDVFLVVTLAVIVGFAFARRLLGALLLGTLAVLVAPIGTATTAATAAATAFAFTIFGGGTLFGFGILDILDNVVIHIVFDNGAIDADMLGDALVGIGHDPGFTLFD